MQSQGRKEFSGGFGEGRGGLESSTGASSLLKHWQRGLLREMASLLRGNFGGKVAVVGLHMRATWAKCLHCSSMLVWIATSAVLTSCHSGECLFTLQLAELH